MKASATSFHFETLPILVTVWGYRMVGTSKSSNWSTCWFWGSSQASIGRYSFVFNPNLDGLPLLSTEVVISVNASSGRCEPARDLIVARMEAAMDLTVPLVVESGISRTWFEGK